MEEGGAAMVKSFTCGAKIPGAGCGLKLWFDSPKVVFCFINCHSAARPVPQQVIISVDWKVALKRFASPIPFSSYPIRYNYSECINS